MRRLLVVVFVLFPQTLLAWGNLGHQTVGAIADRKLTPAARAEVRRLLGGGQSLMSISTKADEIRNARPETKPWHFVDIPKDQDAFSEARDCANDDCVVDQIEHFQTVLADTSASKADRREALMFLTHFVGDLHQPMHCAEATLPGGQSDRGGNLVRVSVLGEPGNNLHRVWDSTLLEEEGLSRGDLVDHLLNDVDVDETEAVQGTAREWAEAAHKLARDNAYGLLPSGNRIDQNYIDTNIEVVDEQLLRAGLRLAHIVNAALAP